MAAPHILDVDFARSQFPALKAGFIFADNAGRQPSYPVRHRSHRRLSHQHQCPTGSRLQRLGSRTLFNAESNSEIAFGPSSTSNLENLARGLEPDIQPGDEFIVTGEHEANCGAWKKLAARRGAVVKYWHSTPTHPNNPYSFSLKVEDLLPLITAKTRIVAFTATSNLLGSVVPVQEITRALRADAAAKGAKKVEVSIDCVAYAPHRRMDVKAWDIVG
ncbi:Aminotran-5 domain-containing protein [Mycena indigotica]|uniref:Aminotran-5 domain-containing protein n=1 Tax=Mycena indigotica TaxID=2126181 RepID=A0A8H6VZD9_9AGAR|nr:Aminotran-5 domain-containing protein [Mycena indigotica]KAF7297421.1 Aminotran-5 domain-containing protein [Mycena indigotica]